MAGHDHWIEVNRESEPPQFPAYPEILREVLIVRDTGTEDVVVHARPHLQPLDTTSCNPGLQPLADNGGPTRTRALNPPNGACAVDMGPVSTTLAVTDQRGPDYPRKIGKATDIGAYEVQPTDRIFIDGFDGPL